MYIITRWQYNIYFNNGRQFKRVKFTLLTNPITSQIQQKNKNPKKITKIRHDLAQKYV